MSFGCLEYEQCLRKCSVVPSGYICRSGCCKCPVVHLHIVGEVGVLVVALCLVAVVKGSVRVWVL